MRSIVNGMRGVAHDQLIILLPVFNDWDSLNLLLPHLDAALQQNNLSAQALVIDDGSTVPMPVHRLGKPLRGITRLDILHLRRNLGHQRAIAIGLAFLHATRRCRAAIIMDADGEDLPSDIPRLITTLREEQWHKIIFAERTRRSEDRLFRLFYYLYRVLHRILTGFSVRVGHFSAIPSTSLASLVVISELWNHYAAAVFKARLPYATIPTTRGTRLAGPPTMNFTGLMVHGLSALSVYGDVIGVRLLVAAVVLTLLVASALLVALVIRFATSLAIPGWATYTIGILLSLLLQIVAVCFLLIFTILTSRSNLSFIPMRDYKYFVKGTTSVFNNEA